MNRLYHNALCNSVLYKNYSFHSNPVRIAHIKAQTFEHLAEYQFHSEKHHKTGGNSYPILSCEYARAHIFAKIRKGTFREKTRGIFRLRSEPNLPARQGHKRVETAVFQKQFPFNYTKSSKVEQKYSISPLKCLQSVILKSEVSIMQCKGSTKSTVSGRFKIIVAEISGVICGVKIQVAAAANMK